MEETQPLLSETLRPSFRSPPSGIPRETAAACVLILITVLLERVAFYGIVGNLVMFLNQQPYTWMFFNATNALFWFTAVSFIFSIFGGWLADAVLDKFKTIAFFFVIYICGYVIFPLLFPHPYMGNNVSMPPSWCWTAHNSTNSSSITNHTTLGLSATWMDIDEPHVSPWDENCAWAVYLALTVMGIGCGAVKANISPFGAEQVKRQGPAATRVFFNWFYWCINLGSLLALGGLAYVQQEISFFWGYLAPCIVLALSLVVFIAGRGVYSVKPAVGSILTNIFKILKESCCSRRRVTENGNIDGSPDPPPSCLDKAKIRYGGSFHEHAVEDVKMLGKVLCVFAAMIPYWIAYFQMETTFIIQGLHMRLDFNQNATTHGNMFKIPVAWLSLFDVIFLIMLIPLMDRVIYPWLDRHGYQLTMRLRIVIGMVFALLAVACAGFVEMYRLHVYWNGGKANPYHQRIGGTDYLAANVTILMQIPQYALIGISEVFASIAGLELAYLQAPRSMQGLIMGIFWFTQGIGSVLGSLTIYWFHGTWFFDWDHGNISCGNVPCGTKADPHKKCRCHLDYYFFFLVGVQVVGIILFGIIAWRLDMGGTNIHRPRVNKRIRPRTESPNNNGGNVQHWQSGTESDSDVR